MKKPWVRPPGCTCEEKQPARFRCTAQWMRCNSRIDHVMRRLGVPTLVRTRRGRATESCP
jgi:hypothetical protein